ncbi:MAG: DUF4091 domain-containing protein [Armatimonadetes bacterium]|nr:DUF4091 domain-containing protein [Armatimonadota bacterium]
MAYDDLLNSPANLVRNPSFEDADAMQATWPGGTEGQQAAAVKVERVDGGKFGTHCVRITVPPEAPANWVGWRQKVRITSGASYFVAAWLRARGLTGEARVHGHFLDDAGQLAGPKFWSTGGSVGGDDEWKLVSGLVSMSGPVSTFELHLTMNVRGVLEHDGAVMMRTVRAALGEIEQRQARPGLAVWAEDPLVKVFRDTPAGKLPAAPELAGGRNEAECLQLCLRSSAAASVTVKLEPLRSGAAALPPGRIETVGYVPCLQPSGYFSSSAKPYERRLAGGTGRTDGWRGWWPDYLVPSDGRIALEARRTQPLWITYAVSRDAAPGEYRGDVVVEQAGQPPVRVPVRLRVWRFVMPDRASLQVIYDLRNGPGWSTFRTEEDWRTWWRFMAEHHVCPDEIQPRAGFKLVDGKVVMDTAAFDRAAAYCYDELHMSAGYFAGPFYACGWAHPPSPFLGLKYPSPEYQAAYQDAVRQYWAHLKAKGWADRLSLYVSDEPWADRREVIQWLADIIGYTRAVDPQIPVYSSTWGHVKAWDGVLNHVGLGQYGVYPMSEWAERRKAGDKAWFTTDGQMEIDTPYNATERMLPWYCFTHGVDGYEFWGFSWYTYDPYKFGWHSFIYQSGEPGKYDWVRYPNGDGFIAYPGEPLGRSGPLSTIRLEEAREGIEDYDLLLAARAAAAKQPHGELAKALAEVAGLTRIPNAGGYRSTDILPDPDALTSLRRRIGDLLDKTP